MGFLRCLIYFAVLGIFSFVAGRLVPKTWFHADRPPFRSFRWEKNGAVYNNLHIRKWQNKVPDMSRIFPKLMPPKKLEQPEKADLPLMIQETCIAEAVHFILCLLGPVCLVLWPGIGGLCMMLVYILLGNLPFLLIQRYNRPRLCRLLKRVSQTKPKKELHPSYGNLDSQLQYRPGT